MTSDKGNLGRSIDNSVASERSLMPKSAPWMNISKHSRIVWLEALVKSRPYSMHCSRLAYWMTKLHAQNGCAQRCTTPR